MKSLVFFSVFSMDLLILKLCEEDFVVGVDKVIWVGFCNWCVVVVVYWVIDGIWWVVGEGIVEGDIVWWLEVIIVVVEEWELGDEVCGLWDDVV